MYTPFWIGFDLQYGNDWKGKDLQVQMQVQVQLKASIHQVHCYWYSLREFLYTKCRVTIFTTKSFTKLRPVLSPETIWVSTIRWI